LAPCKPWPVQLRFATDLTSEQYVKQQAWQSARLQECPLHRKGGRDLARHGAYVRAGGFLVPRFYCRKGKTTFLLLPEFLAARMTGTLAEVEAVVVAAQEGPTQEAAAKKPRPDIDPPGALRWMRRRTQPIAFACLAVATMYPQEFTPPATLTEMRRQKQSTALLRDVRKLADSRLQSLPAPLGFRRRSLWRPIRQDQLQHRPGADSKTEAG